MFFVGANDALHQGVAHHVAFAEFDDGDTFDVSQHTMRLEQAGMLVGRQVNLCFIAGDHGLRAVAQAGEEHQHLLRGRVLRFIQDDEGVVQGTSANVGQRRDFNGGYSTFDSQAGKLLKVYSDRGELFGFCNSWTDIHSKTASADEPFVYQTTIPRGILSADSLIKYVNTLAWAGGDQNIHKLGAAYATSVISTPEISRLIEDDASQSSIQGFSFDQEGHSFGIWSGTDWTMAHDAKTGVWHRRKSYGYDRWRANHSVRAFGKTLVGDRLSGKIFYIDKDVFTEDSGTMVWQVVSPPMHAFPNGGIVDALHLDLATGYGSLGSTPKVMVETSTDVGNTFTQYRELSLGTPGQYQAHVTARRLGRFGAKGMVFRVSVSDSCARALVGVDAEVRPLKR